jgi:hypothetical protein
MTNRYNSETRLVRPVANPSHSDAYAMTPAQAQQLDRMTQPIAIPAAPASQVSETRIDVSQIFEPIQIKEQHTPAQRAAGFFLRSLPFVGGALLLSVAGAYLVELAFVEWLGWLAVMLLIVFVVVNHQEHTYSSAGLALRHQKDAKDALHVIVASNEAVTLAKLENENKAHEREIGLRREVLQSYLNRIGSKDND